MNKSAIKNDQHAMILVQRFESTFDFKLVQICLHLLLRQEITLEFVVLDFLIVAVILRD